MRHITYGGKNSLDDFGLRINSERSGTPGLAGQRTPTISIPRRDGDIMQTAGLESAPLDYCFIVRGSGRAECEAKMRAVTLWLSGRKGDLIDSDFPGTKFMNAVMGEAPEVEWVSRNFAAAYLTVHLKADPIMREISAVYDRVLKWAANGNSSLIVGTNSGYALTCNGTTIQGSFPVTVNAPYTYRLIAACENYPRMKLDNVTFWPDTIFTMPTELAQIEITATGYGYYELWHDTRQEVRL